jgi:hypothetical protein
MFTGEGSHRTGGGRADGAGGSTGGELDMPRPSPGFFGSSGERPPGGSLGSSEERPSGGFLGSVVRSARRLFSQAAAAAQAS